MNKRDKNAKLEIAAVPAADAAPEAVEAAAAEAARLAALAAEYERGYAAARAEALSLLIGGGASDNPAVFYARALYWAGQRDGTLWLSVEATRNGTQTHVVNKIRDIVRADRRLHCTPAAPYRITKIGAV